MCIIIINTNKNMQSVIQCQTCDPSESKMITGFELTYSGRTRCDRQNIRIIWYNKSFKLSHQSDNYYHNKMYICLTKFFP